MVSDFLVFMSSLLFSLIFQYILETVGDNGNSQVTDVVSMSSFGGLCKLTLFKSYFRTLFQLLFYSDVVGLFRNNGK